jgi:hypothetical protein
MSAIRTFQVMKVPDCRSSRQFETVRLLSSVSDSFQKAMKNIQIIDGAVNATYSIFQATEREFDTIFPAPGQDIEIVEDYVSRVGEEQAERTLCELWKRPIHKRDAQGIHGTLFYDYTDRAIHLPQSKREIDRVPAQLNEWERALYAKLRTDHK